MHNIHNKCLLIPSWNNFVYLFVGLNKNDNTQKENSSLSTKDTQQLNNTIKFKAKKLFRKQRRIIHGILYENNAAAICMWWCMCVWKVLHIPIHRQKILHSFRRTEKNVLNAQLPLFRFSLYTISRFISRVHIGGVFLRRTHVFHSVCSTNCLGIALRASFFMNERLNVCIVDI